MATRDAADGSAERRDYSALIILAILGLVEVAILYVLIAVDTPVRPLVLRLLKNPVGVLTLVMFVVTLLCYGMVAVLSWAERHHRNTMSTSARPPGTPAHERGD